MPAPMAAPTPAPVVSAPVTSTRSGGKGASGLTTGIAVGLLAGILLVGGPMLYRNTWGTPAPAAVVEAPVAEAAKPAEPVKPELVTEVPEEVVPEAEAPKVEAKGTAPRKIDPKAPTGPKDNLTEEQRALLARMGGGGEIPMGSKPNKQESAASGPSLTAAQLSAVVQNNKNVLQRCYESALRATGGHQDTIKVTVTVTVGESGSVKNVTTQGNGLGNLNDCLKTSVKRWRFPASGGESEFAFPLVFQPGA
jgi:hypothetical protein